jgi:AbiV family abortive infection protein
MISLDKLDRMAGLVFQNCIRLHFDSITLFESGSFPSAFFLSILSLEEYGKIFWIEDLLWHSLVEGRWESEWEQKWLQSTLDHGIKQRTFRHHHQFSLPKWFVNAVETGKLEVEKQNSVYVGFPKKERKMDLNGRIINPRRINCERAKRQITIVNDSLLENVLGMLKDVGSFESESINALISRELYNELAARWKYLTPKMAKRLKKLESLEDDAD